MSKISILESKDKRGDSEFKCTTYIHNDEQWWAGRELLAHRSHNVNYTTATHRDRKELTTPPHTGFSYQEVSQVSYNYRSITTAAAAGRASDGRRAALIHGRVGCRVAPLVTDSWPSSCVAHAGGGHHGHRVQTGEHHTLRSHGLQVVLVALPQFGTDHALCSRHVVYAALHRDDPLQIETVYVIDAETWHQSVC